MDQHLNFESHVDQMCTKARQRVERASLILRYFRSRDPVLLTKAFVTYDRPIFEYASGIWSPYKLSYIDMIESVQKRFTKRLCMYVRMYAF